MTYPSIVVETIVPQVASRSRLTSSTSSSIIGLKPRVRGTQDSGEGILGLRVHVLKYAWQDGGWLAHSPRQAVQRTLPQL